MKCYGVVGGSVVKKAPHLRVVKGSSADDASSGRSMDIVAVGELSDIQRKRVEHIVRTLCPHAGLLGVAVTSSRAWDLRPFVAVAGEAGPSVMRFLGPEVSMCKNLHIRLRDMFPRIVNNQGLSSTISDWGEFEEQLWYRRPLFDHTLRDFLSDHSKLSLRQMLDIGQEVVSVVENWHSKGVFHGHITEDNVVISPSGVALLVDTGVGLSLFQASKSFGFSDVVEGYDERSFATEARTGQTLISSSDVYGLGAVLESLVEHVDADSLADSHNKIVEGLFQLSDWASAPDAVRRPSLADIKMHLAEYQGRLLERHNQGKNVSTNAQSESSGGAVHTKVAPTRRTPERVVNECAVRGKTIAPKRNVSKNELLPSNSAPDSAVASLQNVENAYKAHYVTQTSSVVAKVVTDDNVGNASKKVFVDTTSVSKNRVNDNVSSRVGDVYGRNANSHNEIVHDVANKEFVAIAAEPKVAVSAVENDYGSVNNNMAVYHSVVSQQKSWLPVYVFMILVLVCMEYLYGLSGFVVNLFRPASPVVYTDDELDVAWSSELPSRMKKVVNAVFQEGGSEHAEELIVESANAGKGALNGMNMALIRMAFKEEWRRQLTPDDRKAALFFGLNKLVDDSVVKSLKPIADLHPGVILSIMATAANESSLSAFNSIPLKKLTALPMPYGGAFDELVRSDAEATCGGREAYLLARFIAIGVSDVRLLKEYVSKNTPAKLKSLALVYYIDDQRARQVIDWLVNHRNIRFDYPYVDWAKRAELLNWDEINGATQLFILAGYVPSSGVSLDEKHMLHMLAHPEPSIRSYAIKYAIDLVKFNHPAAVEVFTLLENKPSLLDEKQTAMLARFLVSPSTATTDAVRDWLNTNPAYEVLVPFVLSSINMQYQSQILDFEIAHYLQRNQWRPTIEQLEQLIYHPTPIMRAFAYSEVKKQVDVQKIRDLLQKALQKETDADLISMLESNLTQAAKQVGAVNGASSDLAAVSQ